MSCREPMLYPRPDEPLILWLRRPCRLCGLLRAECRSEPPNVKDDWGYFDVAVYDFDQLPIGLKEDAPFPSDEDRMWRAFEEVEKRLATGGAPRVRVHSAGDRVPSEPIEWAPRRERNRKERAETGSWCVYVMWSHGGTCLYVGQSVRLPDRLKNHASDKPWWTEVAAVEVWHLDSYASMDQAERRLIRDLKPQYNLRAPAPALAIPSPKETNA